MKRPGFPGSSSFWLVTLGGLLLVWLIVVTPIASLRDLVAVVALLTFTLVSAWRLRGLAALEKQAQTDVKTGLLNSRHFDTLYAAELERSRRFRRHMGVVMADLDLLRNINNSYGHLAGDVVLHEVGRIFRDKLRSYDIASRFGGEEFALVLPEAGPEEANRLAERVRLAVADHLFHVDAARPPIHTTISLGVACYPEDGTNAVKLLKAADRALYAAKADGRNCTRLAGDLPSTCNAPDSSQRTHTAPARPANSIGRFEWRPYLAAPARLSATLVVLFSLLVTVAAASALGFAAAENAVPGDGLYLVKLAVQDTRIRFNTDPAFSAFAQLSIARTRLAEIQSLASQGRYSLIPLTVTRWADATRRARDFARALASSNPRLGSALLQEVERETAGDLALFQELDKSGPPALHLVLAVTLSRMQDAAPNPMFGTASASVGESVGLARGRAGDDRELAIASSLSIPPPEPTQLPSRPAVPSQNQATALHASPATPETGQSRERDMEAPDRHSSIDEIAPAGLTIDRARLLANLRQGSGAAGVPSLPAVPPVVVVRPVNGKTDGRSSDSQNGPVFTSSILYASAKPPAGAPALPTDRHREQWNLFK